MKPRLLVACESSGVVRDAFIRAGVLAVSCDLLPTERPGPHIQGDALRAIRAASWDAVIAHPPCTFLCSSGMHRTTRGLRPAYLTDDAVYFALELFNAPAPYMAMENPVGVLSTRFRPPDQYVHPYMFGHDASKKTGLWLRGFPLLVPTDMVPPRYVCPCGASYAGMERETECPVCGTYYRRQLPRWANQTDSGQNRVGPSRDRWKMRSQTYTGIAEAMAAQWAPVLLGDGAPRKPCTVRP